jgi:hypothetical protein
VELLAKLLLLRLLCPHLLLLLLLKLPRFLHLSLRFLLVSFLLRVVVVGLLVAVMEALAWEHHLLYLYLRLLLLLLLLLLLHQ